MAYKVRILPTAEQEVASITSYLFGYSNQAAAKFIEIYERQLQLLGSGLVDYGLSHIPELAELGYHSCRVNKYALLYFYEDNDIVIAHVFHQRQDYARIVEPIMGITFEEESTEK